MPRCSSRSSSISIPIACRPWRAPSLAILRRRPSIVTTPNGEFNALLGVPAHRFRHPDHRFEWGRAKFRTWAEGVAKQHGYESRLYRCRLSPDPWRADPDGGVHAPGRRTAKARWHPRDMGYKSAAPLVGALPGSTAMNLPAEIVSSLIAMGLIPEGISIVGRTPDRRRLLRHLEGDGRRPHLLRQARHGAACRQGRVVRAGRAQPLRATLVRDRRRPGFRARAGGARRTTTRRCSSSWTGSTRPTIGCGRPNCWPAGSTAPSPPRSAASSPRSMRRRRATRRSPRCFPTGALFEALRLDPYLRATGVRHPALAGRLNALADRTAATRKALVHGDVSPKNIMIGPRRRPGHPRRRMRLVWRPGLRPRLLRQPPAA